MDCMWVKKSWDGSHSKAMSFGLDELLSSHEFKL